MSDPYEFKPGEKVTSNIMGYYYGVPGTITGRSIVNLEGKRSYRIQLDSGKIISLQYDYIRRMQPGETETDPEPEEIQEEPEP